MPRRPRRKPLSLQQLRLMQACSCIASRIYVAWKVFARCAHLANESRKRIACRGEAKEAAADRGPAQTGCRSRSAIADLPDRCALRGARGIGDPGGAAAVAHLRFQPVALL